MSWNLHRNLFQGVKTIFWYASFFGTYVEISAEVEFFESRENFEKWVCVFNVSPSCCNTRFRKTFGIGLYSWQEKCFYDHYKKIHTTLNFYNYQNFVCEKCSSESLHSIIKKIYILSLNC